MRLADIPGRSLVWEHVRRWLNERGVSAAWAVDSEGWAYRFMVTGAGGNVFTSEQRFVITVPPHMPLDEAERYITTTLRMHGCSFT